MKKMISLITFMCVAAILFAGCQPPAQQGHTHTLQHNEAKAATCGDKGSLENWACQECGKYFADAEAAKELALADLEIDALGHTAGEDDGDCTTAVDCTVCGKVAIAAKSHTAGEDDNDCTTAVACTQCQQIAVAAKAEHTDADGDNFCDTQGCTYEFPDTAEKIYTVEDFAAAFLKGGSYKLMNSLELGDTYVYTEDSVTLELDLGGNTVTISTNVICIDYNSVVNLSNGTILQTSEYTEAISCRGEANISDCTLIGANYCALYIVDGEAVVKDSVLVGGVYVSTAYEDSASIIATDNVEIRHGENFDAVVSVDKKSTATFSFDPTSLFDTYNEGWAVDNGDGTWTVMFEEGVGDAVITGLELYGDAVKLEGNTYTVTIPKDVTYVQISVRVIGQNMYKIPVDWLDGYYMSIGDNTGSTYKINAACRILNQSAIYDDDVYIHASWSESGPKRLLFSNDNCVTWEDTGYVVVVVVEE